MGADRGGGFGFTVLDASNSTVNNLVNAGSLI